MVVCSNRVMTSVVLSLALFVSGCTSESNGKEAVGSDASTADDPTDDGSSGGAADVERDDSASAPSPTDAGPEASQQPEASAHDDSTSVADEASELDDDSTDPTDAVEAGGAALPEAGAGGVDLVDSGIIDPATSPEAGLDAPSIEWTESDDRVGSRRIELATLEVPVDYNRPNGDQLELSLARLRTSSAARRGVMLFNPGGPGATLIWDAPYLLTQLSLMFENLDIVLMDNRGMGRSSPMQCYEVADEPLAEEDDSIEAQVADGVTYIANLLEACDERFGDRMKFFNSENVARDMERLRLGLGEERLHFWGVSYGTMQGALYAAMFPDAVGGWVLDSPVVRFGEREPHMIDLFVEGSEHYELQLNRFVSFCDASDECGLSNELPGGAVEALDVLQQSLDDGATYEGIQLPRFMLAAFIETVLRYGDWALLDVGLSDALRDDWYVVLLVLFGESGEDEQDTKNSEFANVIINRVDFGCPLGFTTQDAVEVATMVAAEFPRLGPWSAVRAGLCVGWDIERSEDAIIPSGIEAPPIAVMGALNDPATPYENALRLVDQLDNGSLLLSADIEGHGVGLANDCALDALISVIDRGSAEGLPEACGEITPQGARVSSRARDAASRLSGWLEEQALGTLGSRK